MNKQTKKPIKKHRNNSTIRKDISRLRKELELSIRDNPVDIDGVPVQVGDIGYFTNGTFNEKHEPTSIQVMKLYNSLQDYIDEMGEKKASSLTRLADFPCVIVGGERGNLYSNMPLSSFMKYKVGEILVVEQYIARIDERDKTVKCGCKTIPFKTALWILDTIMSDRNHDCPEFSVGGIDGVTFSYLTINGVEFGYSELHAFRANILKLLP